MACGRPAWEAAQPRTVGARTDARPWASYREPAPLSAARNFCGLPTCSPPGATYRSASSTRNSRRRTPPRGSRRRPGLRHPKASDPHCSAVWLIGTGCRSRRSFKSFETAGVEFAVTGATWGGRDGFQSRRRSCAGLARGGARQGEADPREGAACGTGNAQRRSFQLLHAGSMPWRHGNSLFRAGSLECSRFLAAQFQLLPVDFPSVLPNGYSVARANGL